MGPIICKITSMRISIYLGLVHLYPFKISFFFKVFLNKTFRKDDPWLTAIKGLGCENLSISVACWHLKHLIYGCDSYLSPGGTFYVQIRLLHFLVLLSFCCGLCDPKHGPINPAIFQHHRLKQT